MKKRRFTFLLAVGLLAGCESSPEPGRPEPAGEKATEPSADMAPAYKISVNFGPFEKYQRPHPDQMLPAGQLQRRLKILHPYADWIRTYGLGSGLDTIPALARQMGFRVAAGAWLGRDEAANEREIDRLIGIGRAGQADLLIVGSETQLRRDLSPDQLVVYLKKVKQAVPGVPVATADVSKTFIDNPAITAACDLIFANIYPYWSGKSIDCAMQYFDDQYRALKKAAAGKEIRISESGWPSGGNAISEAQATPDNAAIYLRHLLGWSAANAVQVFVFEAFDEEWKAEEEGPQGAHWGLFDEAGALKPAIRPVLYAAPEPSAWKSCRPGPPTLIFTDTPAYGASSGWLRGQAQGLDFDECRVVVLIRVQGVWWIKPYANERTITLGRNGEWSADIVTGGQDAFASEIAAFLVPADYDPPAVLGWKAIPKGLKKRALAQTIIRRHPR